MSAKCIVNGHWQINAEAKYGQRPNKIIRLYMLLFIPIRKTARYY